LYEKWKNRNNSPDSPVGPNGKSWESPEAYGGTTMSNMGPTGSNGKPFLSPEAYGGSTITNGTVETPKSDTGTTIEQQINDSTPSVVTPITNNIVNNNGGGGGRGSDIGMPSVRTLDPSFVRWQDKRQSRVF
jgi:hypothetical protein